MISIFGNVSVRTTLSDCGNLNNFTYSFSGAYSVSIVAYKSKSQTIVLPLSEYALNQIDSSP